MNTGASLGPYRIERELGSGGMYRDTVSGHVRQCSAFGVGCRGALDRTLPKVS